LTNRFRISHTLFQRLEDAGLNPFLVLQQSGLPLSILNQEKVHVTTEEMFALYRATSALSEDPGIGLKLGTARRFERYDPVAIAALCTRTFREALHKLSRYKQLTCPEEVKIEQNGDECSVSFNWLLAQESEPGILIDVCFAWVVTIARHGTGRALHPRRVEFKRAAEHRRIYEDHFQCAIVFDAPQNRLIFDTADLDEPFLTSNADLLATVAPQLEAELKRRQADMTVAEQVKAVLKRMFAGQRPELHHVARELGFSTRTLQRRLSDERLTFQHLVKEARRELAQQYLLNSSLELNETAYLLGYEDANSFFRAFREWEGTSPGEWRTARACSSMAAQA
jgi:AraC-like DNA-binding protein